MSDIFISYARADHARVVPLVDALRQRGWSVWWDRTILPGQNWNQAIEAALAAARCVIVLWSRDSIQRDWVRNEADEARRRGILVPVLLDDVNMPLAFRGIQAASLVNWSCALQSAEFDNLVQAVSEVLLQSAPLALEETTDPSGVTSATAPAGAGVPHLERGESGGKGDGEQVVTEENGSRSVRRAEHLNAEERRLTGKEGNKVAEAAQASRRRTLLVIGVPALVCVASFVWYVVARSGGGTHGPTKAFTINLFDGTRKAIPQGTRTLLTVSYGTQKQLFRDFVSGPRISLVPLHNFADAYTVTASAEGYEQAGYSPIKLDGTQRQGLDLMLLPNNGYFRFARANWDLIQKERPVLANILAAGSISTVHARNRYLSLLGTRPKAAACLLNIMTALGQIHLQNGTPMTYLRQLIWDDTMAPDQVFGWADPAIIQQIELGKAFGFFDAPGVAKSGVTHSYSQIQYGEAKLQLAFYEFDLSVNNGSKLIKIEAEFKYLHDPYSHVLLEAVPNSTGSLMDPKEVYVLRWMAGRHVGVPEFDPLYTIE